MFDGSTRLYPANYYGHLLDSYTSKEAAQEAVDKAGQELTEYYRAQRAHVPAEPRDGIWGN